MTHFYILAFFGYLLKTDHFFWRETFSYPNFNSFMHAEWPNWYPSKSFLVVIDKNNARILIRLCRRTQNALNWLKIQPFLDCQIIFIWLSVSIETLILEWNLCKYTYINNIVKPYFFIKLFVTMYLKVEHNGGYLINLILMHIGMCFLLQIAYNI